MFSREGSFATQALGRPSARVAKLPSRLNELNSVVQRRCHQRYRDAAFR